MSKMSKKGSLRKRTLKRRLSKRNIKKSRKSRRMKRGGGIMDWITGKISPTPMPTQEQQIYNNRDQTNSSFEPKTPGSKIPVMEDLEYDEYRKNYPSKRNPVPVQDITLTEKSWF